MKIEYPSDMFNNEELKNTPERHKRFIKEWSSNKSFIFTKFLSGTYNQMIILKDIEFASLCSHHLLPFYGTISIGYIPDKYICGISKLARTVDKFANKPQIQEQLTQDILNYLKHKLSPKGIIVIVKARHTCMIIRGVKKQKSTMLTSAIYGVFSQQKVRSEFLELLK